jgi:N-methylhydantoinase B
VRVVTTGGGGWGDPIEREAEWVARDVIDGKVSLAGARDDYGVVLKAQSGGEPFGIDAKATADLREKLKAARHGEKPMIDRGGGFEKMIRGEVKPWTRTA